MKRCYLVRHAQTAWNSENRIQGYSDRPLSPLGHQQAMRLGAFFAARRVHRIFTSPLQRSQQTAHAIASGASGSAGTVIEPELAEMHLGAWEGLTPAEVDLQFQGAYQQWRVQPSAVSIPQAEHVSAFRARARRALERVLTSMEQDGEYVVVSHGGVIAAVLSDLLRADYDAVIRRMRLDNAGITALECGTGTPHVLWINFTDHLSDLSAPESEAWF